MSEISDYRKKYFALCRDIGLDEDTRHAYNESVIGEASTRAWTKSQWQQAIHELEIRAGTAPPDEDDGYGPIEPVDGMATYAQCRLLCELAHELRGYWREGAAAYVRARVLEPQSSFRAMRWSGRWEDLWPAEASKAIQMMRALKDQVKALGLDGARREDVS